MGASWNQICKDCGTKYKISTGGGFVFHNLRCDKCGKEKTVSFSELGEIHLKYLKGLGKPYSIATMGYDKYIRESYPGDTINEGEYHRLVEEFAGKCECGGNYTFDGPTRCPNCRSANTEVVQDGDFILYD